MSTEGLQKPPTYTEAPRQPNYQAIPEGDPMDPYPPPEPPQGGYYQQSPGYAPVPAAFPPQQQTSNNVVVVGQPTAPASTVVVERHTYDYTILTIVMMLICFLHCNYPAFICLVPALVFANMASESTNAGNFDEARQYGRMALWFNLGTFAYYAVFIVVTVIAVAVVVSSHSRYDDFPDY